MADVPERCQFRVGGIARVGGLQRAVHGLKVPVRIGLPGGLGLRGPAVGGVRREVSGEEQANAQAERGQAAAGQESASGHALALQLAHLPGQIKGFGHVKARHLAAARERWSELLAQWRAQAPAGDRA